MSDLDIDPDKLTYIPPEEMKAVEVWHKFIGDMREPGRHEIRDHVLCFKFEDRNPIPDDGEFLHVAMYNQDVTCKSCIELIRS